MARVINETPVQCAPEAAEHWRTHGSTYMRIECEPEDTILFGPCPDRVTYRDFRFFWIVDENEAVGEGDVTWEHNGIRFVAKEKHLQYMQGGNFYINHENAIRFYHSVAEENKGKYNLKRLPHLPDVVYVLNNHCVHDTMMLAYTACDQTGKTGLICTDDYGVAQALARRYEANSGAYYDIMELDTDNLTNYAEKYRIDGVFYLEYPNTMNFYAIDSVPQE